MDDEEFKRRLSEVAEWHIPTDADKPYAKTKRKKRNEQLVEMVGEDGDEEVIADTGPNLTIPPIITKLKIQGCWCEDCGKYCENGRQTEKKIYKTGKTHWRERCVTCKMFKHPVSGEYTMTNIEASHFFTNLNRETQGINRSKFNKMREQVQRTKTVIESDTATITFYHEKNTSA